MPDFLTPQTLASAGPLVVDTFFKHFFSHKSLTARSKARGEDLLYDEAFVLMKTFLESATKYPVSSLQKFGQVRTPAPPAVALYHITIPPSSLAIAAEYLVTALGGPEMAYKIAGGSKWWQVRAGSGVEAEWIVMKRDFRQWEKDEREKGKGKSQEKQAAKSTDRRRSEASGAEAGPSSSEEVKSRRKSWWGAASPNTQREESSKLRESSNTTSSEIPQKVKETEDADGNDEGVCKLQYETKGSDRSSKRNGFVAVHAIHTRRCILLGLNQHSQIHDLAIREEDAREMFCRELPKHVQPFGAPIFPVHKAPQYPFPCAIQDCLAAYLYLTRPPPGAKHRPVRPEHLIIAGDSAGGGLVLALLQILRDTEGLTLPAGAVLISPWSDLTHSFPSILHNTATDIVPPYSFIHKPSSLWPPPPPDLTEVIQSRLKDRIKRVTTHLRSSSAKDPEPAHQEDTEDPHSLLRKISIIGRPIQMSEKLRSSQLGERKSKPFKLFGTTGADLHPTTKTGDPSVHPAPQGEPRERPSRANPAESFAFLQDRTSSRDGQDTIDGNTTLARCSRPIELSIQGEQVVIDTQIQLYATNAQLCHPLVSPALGYLGGLCPLYVCAGQNEVLRDEIIYLAHKAANPERFPLRDDVRAMMPHYEGIEARYGPTQVHLQVFDGTCHDLPLFSMCRSARGVFRAITAFSRHVTPSASYLGSTSTPSKSKTEGSAAGSATSFFVSPFTALGGMSGVRTPKSGAATPRPASVVEAEQKEGHGGEAGVASPGKMTPVPSVSSISPSTVSPPQDGQSGRDTSDTSRDVGLLRIDSDMSIPRVPSPLAMSPVEPKASSTPATTGAGSSGGGFSRHRVAFARAGAETENDSEDEGVPSGAQSPLRHATDGLTTVEVSGDDAGPRWGYEEDSNVAAKEGEAGWPGVYRGPNAWKDNMIRERVSVHGHLRPLEPPSELDALTMPADEIGMIKEGPALRYLTGQYLWDRRYKHARKSVARHREKNLLGARKDGGKILEGVRRRWEGERERMGERMDRRRERKDGVVPAIRERGEGDGRRGRGGEAQEAWEGSEDESGSGWETAREDMSEEEAEELGAVPGGEEAVEDLSWSWDWALEGEVPPPSAIVSRRDTSEARHLALIADRLDSSHPSSLGGLSIWVMLATFFSNSSERDRAHEAFKAGLKEDEEAKRSAPFSQKGKSGDGGESLVREKGQEKRNGRTRGAQKEKTRSGLGRFGSALGLK